jgi:hypothetical protein
MKIVHKTIHILLSVGTYIHMQQHRAMNEMSAQNGALYAVMADSIL